MTRLEAHQDGPLSRLVLSRPHIRFTVNGVRGFFLGGVMVAGVTLAVTAGCGSEAGQNAAEGGANAPGTAPGSTPTTGPGTGLPNSPPLDISAPSYVPRSGALRLTRAEIDNSLAAALGDESGASAVLAEDEFSPYDNNLTDQIVSQALVEGLGVLAEDTAARVAADPSFRTERMPCVPAGPADAACFDQVVQTFGEALLRRPFLAKDIEHYRPLLVFGEEQADFYESVRLLLQTLLQDPEFVYRIERGVPTTTLGIYALQSHEIATRLSYLILGSAPPRELLTDARLQQPEGRRELAAELLTDPRARQQLHRFHGMWLGYRAIPHGAELNAAFQRETEALIDRVIFDEPGAFTELFSSSETYLTDALAEHYGLPKPAGGAGWVSYPAEVGRAGILSHGSVLSGFSKFTDTSPTQRGIFVQTRLLCNDIPPPPPTVDVDQPPGDDESACKVDRYIAHQDRSGCAECHQLFDPIGLGLENFDRAGRYREHDDGAPECLITSTGTLPGAGSFSGPGELSRRLIEDELITPCFVQQFTKFLLGKQQLDPIDQQYVTQLSEQFTRDGQVVLDWLPALAADPAFALRRETEVEQ